MKSISIPLVMLVSLLRISFAASPIEDLASPDQAIRDQAAAELRSSFQSAPESKWAPVVEKISKGQSKKEILALLLPTKVTPAMGVGSGDSHSESYRLDDEWILDCSFRNEGDILMGRTLIRNIRAVDVRPPENFTGQWVLYYINGNKSHEISMKNGHYLGEFTSYYPNGTKAYVQHYTEKGADGADTGYHPSGKVAYSGQYKENKQVGTWTWFDESGQVTSSKDFPNP